MGSYVLCVSLKLYRFVCGMIIGLMSGHKVVGVRMVLEDGVSHPVDSSEIAFKMAAIGALRQGMLYNVMCMCVYTLDYLCPL